MDDTRRDELINDEAVPQPVSILLLMDDTRRANEAVAVFEIDTNVSILLLMDDTRREVAGNPQEGLPRRSQSFF